MEDYPHFWPLILARALGQISTLCAERLTRKSVFKPQQASSMSKGVRNVVRVRKYSAFARVDRAQRC
eukprot:6178139-Pleurochrysis_carterae.AAC.3